MKKTFENQFQLSFFILFSFFCTSSPQIRSIAYISNGRLYAMP